MSVFKRSCSICKRPLSGGETCHCEIADIVTNYASALKGLCTDTGMSVDYLLEWFIALIQEPKPAPACRENDLEY